MDKLTAIAVLDLWVATTTGWYEYKNGRIKLCTTEDEVVYENEIEAAESVVQEVYTWISRNYNVL